MSCLILTCTPSQSSAVMRSPGLRGMYGSGSATCSSFALRTFFLALLGQLPKVHRAGPVPRHVRGDTARLRLEHAHPARSGDRSAQGAGRVAENHAARALEATGAERDGDVEQ